MTVTIPLDALKNGVGDQNWESEYQIAPQSPLDKDADLNRQSLEDLAKNADQGMESKGRCHRLEPGCHISLKILMDENVDRSG